MQKARTREARIVLPALALVVVVLRAISFKFRAAIDDVAVWLVFLAALPWLLPVIGELEFEGFGIEAKARQAARREVERLREEEEGPLTVPESKTTSPEPSEPPEDIVLALRNLEGQAQKYRETRASQPSGPARTREMTKIVIEMGRIAREANKPLSTRDIRDLLASPDQGLRLAGCAAARERKEPELAGPLVDSLFAKGAKPFEQYWGLLALNATPAFPGILDGERIALLKSWRTVLPVHSDRRRDLDMFLARVRVL